MFSKCLVELFKPPFIYYLKITVRDLMFSILWSSEQRAFACN